MNSTPLPLKPLHLPPDVSAWPPAPGWWILLTLIVIGLYVGWRYWRRNRQKQAPKRWLEHQLQTLFQQNLGAHQTAQAANRLLRRWALSQGATPGLQGEAWLAFLQQRSAHPLNQSLRVFLTVQAYQPASLLNTAELADIEAALMRFSRTATTQAVSGV